MSEEESVVRSIEGKRLRRPRVLGLGALLRAARKRAGLSLMNLAQALGVSSKSHLHDVEKGRRGLSRQMCDDLSRVLGLDRVLLYARAGHLSDETTAYLARRPRALGLLERLAAIDASEGVLEEMERGLRAAGCGLQGPEGEEVSLRSTATGSRLPAPDAEGEEVEVSSL